MDSKQLSFWIIVPVLLIGSLLLARYNTLDIVSKDDYQEFGFDERPFPKRLENFSLLNHDGEKVNSSSLIGRRTLIFFGFTYCPDVCPTTLSILNMALAKLKNPPRVILVSVDPERDSVPLLKKYVKRFNPDFEAYTGEIDEISNFANQLEAGFRKVPGDGEDNWTVDHTSNLVVINAQGEFQGLIRPPLQVESISTLLEIMEREA
ncbi:MAG: protein SCO1/2 [Candidatus Azotimanducaceae bacterium]|jgi:protein SCO1/2